MLAARYLSSSLAFSLFAIVKSPFSKAR